MDSLTALSSLTSGLSAFGDAASLYGQANALDLNAGILDIKGKSEISAAEYTARRQREQGDQFMGRIIASYSKAGVKFTGSPALVWAESERNIRMDILTTQLNAANKANAIGFEALNQRIAAGQARTNAIRTIGQGILNMGTNFAMAGGGGKTGGTNIGAGTTSNGVKVPGRYVY
jgi:hypothetical protein